MGMPRGSSHSANSVKCTTTPHSPPNKNQVCRPSRTKKVRFGWVDEREAEEIHHLSQDQIESMWFTRKEYKAFRKALKSSTRDKSGDEYTRDLKCLDKERHLIVKDKVLDILDLQEENRRLGKKSSKGLKTLSLRLSFEDKKEGVLQAVEDAVYASSIYMETMDSDVVSKCFQVFPIG